MLNDHIVKYLYCLCVAPQHDRTGHDVQVLSPCYYLGCNHLLLKNAAPKVRVLKGSKRFIAHTGAFS